MGVLHQHPPGLAPTAGSMHFHHPGSGGGFGAGGNLFSDFKQLYHAGWDYNAGLGHIDPKAGGGGGLSGGGGGLSGGGLGGGVSGRSSASSATSSASSAYSYYGATGAGMGVGPGAAGGPRAPGSGSGSRSSASAAAHLVAHAASTAVPAAAPDSWEPHPLDPLRQVKYEIRQLLLVRGTLSIAQLPEEYLKCYRKPLTQAFQAGAYTRPLLSST